MGEDVSAANPCLEIMHFPVAAPDLNAREQVWKDTRGAISYNHVTTRLSELAQRFEHHPKDTCADAHACRRVLR